jgi:cytochrome c5
MKTANPKQRLILLSLALGLVLTLTACGEPQETTGIHESVSRGLAPADASIAAIYNRSCRSCHTITATGSPLTGDTAAWQPRLDKGMNTLVDNVVNGFGGMPPLGLCMDCDAVQFEALILFMAKGS